ncbi:MAG: hypothetical protein AAGJ31_13035 [Verrucomicrobiota bacterium]
MPDLQSVINQSGPEAKTSILYILDRSGSMQSLTEAAITGFNEFIREQQKTSEEVDDARFSLVLFDDQYEMPHDDLPIQEVPELDTKTFVPRGSTALLDAIGKTLTDHHKRLQALPKEDRPASTIVAIFTDGLENSSHEYTWKDISKLISARRDQDGWEFLFLAANQDAIATAGHLSIDRDSAATVAYSAFGMTSSSKAMSRKVRSTRISLKAKSQGIDAAAPDYNTSLQDLVKEEEEKG